MTHRLPFAATLIATTLLAAPALADNDFPPAISVTGEATVSAPPDQAQLDAGVTTDAKTAREAAEANNVTMGKVLAALKGAGIAEKDYQTSRLSLQPQFANRPAPSPATPPSIVGYHASNRVTIKLHDVSKVAGIIDVLVGAGANDIGGLSFSVSQASKLRDEAREKAIADARRKAEIYAKAAGVTLGAPLDIAEVGSAPGPTFRARMATAGFAAPTPVAQGEEALTVNVSVSWAIKEK
ncbi:MULTISPECIES: SIMPL domain-containing protein [unclassified Bradyrhizobium]|uniref:SIMPL domain-containing protein n=1 Tax=unclassified Bradyrhizobium TaxID=2631580 RepID=UPI00247A6E8C|nr:MULTISPECIES: SIMPL domain-containing protein [unclassified Bradyrhizobium]WGS20960.1 SIMPL domain-containing protein [Bradyrhizobium sp. ISRA463]WGS27866.1 SIMPL domain-containing protein [Bradyrhizobium sp. ISRA464]